MKTQTKNYSLWFVVIAVLLLCGVCWWLGDQILALSEANQLLRVQAEKSQKNWSEFVSAKAESGGLATTLSSVKKYLVDPHNEVAVIDLLEKLAKEAGVTYTLNNALEADQLSLDMSLSGSFTKIYYFLKLLENSGYWLTFENFNLTRQTGPNALWSGNLTISIPFDK